MIDGKARRPSLVAVLISLSFLLISCSPRSTNQLIENNPIMKSTTARDSSLEDQTHRKRLANVFYTLTKSSQTDCNQRNQKLGILLTVVKPETSSDTRLTTTTTIAHVVENSVADQANLNAGDQIKKLNGRTFKPGHLNKTETRFTKRDLIYLGNVVQLESRPVSLTLSRPDNQASSSKYTLQPETTCDVSVHLVESNAINSQAGSNSLKITPAMLDFTETDDELAYVLSHNLAHHYLNHPENNIRNWLTGVSVDMVAFSQGIPTFGMFGYLGHQYRDIYYERKADKYGLQLMNEAGYNVSEAPDCWERLADANPENLESNEVIDSHYYTRYFYHPSYLESHPANPTRQIFLKEQVEKIESNSADSPNDPKGTQIVKKKTQKTRETKTDTNEKRTQSDTTIEEFNLASLEKGPNRNSQSIFEPPKEPTMKLSGLSGFHRVKIDRTTSDENPTETSTRNQSGQSDDEQSLKKNKSRTDTPNGQNSSKETTGLEEPSPSKNNTTPKGRYTIQLASFSRKSGAADFLSDLDLNGESGRIVSSTIGDTTYYRVRIGAYSRRRQAMKRKETLAKRLKWSDYWITTRTSDRRFSYTETDQ